MQISILHQDALLSDVRRVITIGAFDGCHLGHQQLIAQVNLLADTYKYKRSLITFEPLPVEFFDQTHSTGRLMSLRDKVLYLSELDLVDEVLVIPFNHSVFHISAEDFLSDILLKTCKMAALVVGEDFRFGAAATGNIDFLCTQAQAQGFELYVIPDERYAEKRVSSTRIRSCLSVGDFQLAQQLLGHPYTIAGKVIYGNQLARTWGIPTINIALKHRCLPFTGVYNVRAHRYANGCSYHGIANIGVKPTVNGILPSLEVHLHNINENFYGDFFNIEFISKIRDEHKFHNIEQLRMQIELDVDKSRAFFSL